MSGKFLAGGTTDHQCNPPWPVNQEAHDKIIERQNEQVRARHDKLRAEIKSERTKNKIANRLNEHYGDFAKATGSKGNYQVKVDSYHSTPHGSLGEVIDSLGNLTPDHLANLKWKVQK